MEKVRTDALKRS